MRLAAAVIGSLALAAPGDRATATFNGSTLTVTFRYWMTCGQPGAGPAVITLPNGIRIGRLHARQNGKAATISHSGRVVDVTLPKPPGVTCMSITMGTLRIAVTGLRAVRGTYALHAQVNRHSFATSFSVA